MANADWTEIGGAGDLAEIMGQERAAKAWGLYQDAKAVYRQYKAAKGAFEAAMQEGFAEHLEAGNELKFGYNFGKLSIAVGEARERKPKADKARPSLAEFMRTQREQGGKL